MWADHSPQMDRGRPVSEHNTTDYGTDELSSDTLSGMPRSFQSAARRIKGRKQRVYKRDYSSAGSSASEASSSDSCAAPWLRFTLGSRATPAEMTRVPLGEEVASFGAFMVLTQDESASRNLLRSTMQGFAEQHWPEATVKIYGSFSYGLSLPSSDLDMVIEHCADLKSTFSNFVEYCRQNNFEILGVVNSSDNDAFLKTRDQRTSITANITLTSGRSPVRQSVSKIKQQLQRFPAAAPVILVIRTVLAQCNLNDVLSGGLSSFSIILMVIYVCQTRFPDGAHIDPGDLLKEFLRVYGTDFRFKEQSVAIVDAGLANPNIPKVHPDAPISICDPLDPNNNVAETCIKVVQICTMFKYCHMALAKWDQILSPNDAASFRGKTPLSTIIAHKALWSRMSKLSQQVPEHR